MWLERQNEIALREIKVGLLQGFFFCISLCFSSIYWWSLQLLKSAHEYYFENISLYFIMLSSCRILVWNVTNVFLWPQWNMTGWQFHMKYGLAGLEKMFISLQAGQNLPPAGQISFQCGVVSLMYLPSKKHSILPVFPGMWTGAA